MLAISAGLHNDSAVLYLIRVDERQRDSFRRDLADQRRHIGGESGPPLGGVKITHLAVQNIACFPRVIAAERQVHQRCRRGWIVTLGIIRAPRIRGAGVFAQTLHP